MDKTCFIEQVWKLKGAYVSSNFLKTEDVVKMWFEMLKDIPNEDFCEAVDKHLKTKDHPPTIAGLRELAGMQSKNKPTQAGNYKQTKYAKGSLNYLYDDPDEVEVALWEAGDKDGANRYRAEQHKKRRQNFGREQHEN